MNLKERFHQTYPTAFFLEKDIEKVEKHLRQIEWIAPKEKVIGLEKPGEGNMNFVLRVITNDRSFILKQARPWVEKFPQINAPVERVLVETQFFQSLQNEATINSFSPKCLGFDKENFLLATEDLGAGADYSFLYKRETTLSNKEIQQLVKYLSVLHHFPSPENFPTNRSMRKLNHEHIFNFPYLVENGFDLDEVQVGLQVAAMPYKTDAILKEKIKECGKVYLSKGNHLLHGDFYPGSWLKVESGLKIIDPEFGFVGRAEFDLGVLVAHTVMSKQPEEVLQIIFSQYQKPNKFKEKLLIRFAGIEILRRLIGIAQLPLNFDLSEKKSMMQRAADWVMSGQMDFD